MTFAFGHPSVSIVDSYPRDRDHEIDEIDSSVLIRHRSGRHAFPSRY
jgi:hypothetical protein